MCGDFMWIYEHPNWPDFSWNAEKLNGKLAALRHSQGRLLGQMESLGFELRREATLSTLTSDVVKTSAIEGLGLDPAQVRSSIARHLGMDAAGLAPAGQDVEGIVEILLDATGKFDQPLTKERLFGWHAALFPTGRSGMRTIVTGNWRRSSMQVVSGPVGRETVHFQAPDAQGLEQQMGLFLSWFEKQEDVDLVLKAAIAHLWFETLHPFEDGNGRIGRAIADMALARADGVADRFYSLSAQIEAERREYYQQLERHQRSHPEITGWLEWFLGCLGRAIAGAHERLDRVLFKAKLWQYANRQPINQRQQLIINRMVEYGFQGYMSTSKYARMAKCSPDTALRDIQALKGMGILVQNPGKGRKTSYRLCAQPPVVQD